MPDYTFAYNGVSFGAGTSLPYTSLAGLEDLPAVRVSNVNRPGDAGELSGLDLAGGRDVTVELVVIDGSTEYFTALGNLQTATVPQGRSTVLPLTFQLPGPAGVSRSRLIYCRPVKRELTVDPNYSYRIARPRIQFHAVDPRIYDATQQSQGLTAPSGGTGFSWSITWDLSWGGGVTPSTATLGNSGTFETRPKCTIAGPCTNPSLTNNTTGQTLAFNITMAGGDSLVIDFNARTVVLNGTADRLGTIAGGSAWWTIPPGGCTVSFVSSSATGTATFTWRYAWI